MNQDFPFEHFFSSSPEKKSNNFNELSGEPEGLQKAKKATNVDTNKSPKQDNTINSNSCTKNSGSFNESELKTISTEIISLIKNDISEQRYSTFFDSTFFLKNILSDEIVFSVPTPFIKNTIEANYLDLIKKVTKIILGREYQVRLNIEETGTSHSHDKSKENAANSIKNVKDNKFTLDLTPTKEDLLSKVESKYIDHMNPESYGNFIDPNKRFDNFIIGPSNNMAFATAKAVARNPGKNGKYPSLYIYSNSGLGKTHLLHAVANEIHKTHPHLTIYMVTDRDFIT